MLKKATVLLLAFFVLTLSFSACAEKTNGNKAMSGQGERLEEGTETENGEGSEGEFTFERDFIAKNLPKEYRIAYSIKSGPPGARLSSDIVAARSGGKIYFSVDGDETLFIPSAGGYLCYTRDGTNEDFECINESFLMDENTVSTYLTVYTSLFGYYSDFAEIGGLRHEGVGSVAGRSCRKYVYDPELLGLGNQLKISFCIDRETGICLMAKYEADQDSDKNIYDFICTEFITKGIELPPY